MRLCELIDSGRCRVGVVGLGYVGLPLLHAVKRSGLPALGLDHDPDKIVRLRRGENYLPHLGDAMARELSSDPTVKLSSDAGELRCCDAVLICVPTPIDEAHDPDLSAVERAARDIRDHALLAEPGRPRLVVLESTTYPGTTRELVGSILCPGGVDPPGAPALLAFSPEREDPGNPSYTTRTIPKLVGGVTPDALAVACRLYGRIVDQVVPVSSAEVAEAAKLVENVYRAVNIALVNELKVALDAMGLDIWEVLDAAATKPFGYQRFNPGPGFGGHCVPVDPFYLSWKARRVGAETAFIELAGLVNRAMPGFVVSKCEQALAAAGKKLPGARVLVLGLAYKPNIGDVRESPSFELIELLREHGAEVSYHDPYVPRTWRGRRHDLHLESVAWSDETLAEQDLVLVATDHAWYDWAFVARHAGLIVDTRNALRGVTGPAKVVRA